MTREYPGLELQVEPRILISILPGKWLLGHTTPSWRIEDPVEGFQRRVDQDRAKEIASTVLNAGRTFPNAIVLATNLTNITCAHGTLRLPDSVKFLVVDGQHRLWAQRFAKVDARYACLLHLGLDERAMAQLFVEINDNQKRVPSSLRWDLVRLVRKEDDPHGVRAVDLVYDLDQTRTSPLFQRIDLTGEQSEIALKQGSLAPSIKTLLVRRGAALHDAAYDVQLKALSAYFGAIRELDPDGWDSARGPLYKARVLRALLRLMSDVVGKASKERGLALEAMGSGQYLRYLRKIDIKTIDADKIRGQQGSAGIKAIYNTLKKQVLH